MAALPALSLDDPSVLSPSRLTLERARREFSELEAWLLSEEAQDLPLHAIEREQEQRAREVQRLMLQAHIEARGRGDVGRALEVTGGEDAEPVTHTHRRNQPRTGFKTIFGEVAVEHRLGYGARGEESVHPLDEDLQLPARGSSYELQRRAVKAAVQGPYDEAVERIEEATGIKLPKRTVEQAVRDAAQDFDSFYEQRTPPEPDESGPIVVGSVDRKGIPMVKPGGAERKPKLKKGEKANKKKMSTVAAVYNQQPRVRTPEEVTESLFRRGPRVPDDKPRARPEHKRIWAKLEEPKENVIAEAGREMKRRNPGGTKTQVFLTDGERALQNAVENLVNPIAGTFIMVLDLLHVLGYLWKAAYVYHKEGSEEAEAWVRKRVLWILQGRVSHVLRGLRQSVTKRGLQGKKAKTLLGVANYFYRNRFRMRYHEYLRQGLPIATGPVEGACKNLVKDRMERSGMRWTKDTDHATAEAMLKARAAYLSGDFEEFWAHHVEMDQERLHPRRWTPVVVEK